MNHSIPPSKQELLDENSRLRKRIEELEGSSKDLQHTQQLLDESERRFRVWLENSPVCTKILDLDLRLQYMSQAGIDGLKVTNVEQYYGEPFPLSVYSPQVQAEILSDLKRVLEEGVVANRETPATTLDGEEIWFYSTFVPVKDDSGEIEYIIAVSTDISDRKKIEEERALLERRVQHAQKLESLGVLSGGIAHDFNNILMSILGNADLALDTLSPLSPARRNILEVERASRRAADLAKQMLAYSGKGHFIVEPIHLGEFVKEMARLLEVSISKKVELHYNLSQDLPTFGGDTTQIRQVIMNLITNASDSIGDDTGAISLSTGVMECDSKFLNNVNEVYLAGLTEPLEPGSYLYVEVQDTGCGMGEETLGKIFDPFYSTKFTGRGLGMSAVLGIVRGHKGAIQITSELGKGSCFRVFFPTDNFKVSRPVGVGERKRADTWHGSGTVLVVDDEETVRGVAKDMLERLGFHVLTATDGRKGLEVFAEHQQIIQCVLLDLTMPNMSGEEAYRELNRIDGSTPVILCSGYNRLDALEQIGKVEGVAEFLQKPYDISSLRSKLSKVLGDHLPASI
jgi:PAS domain S-box-containing protein